MGHKGLAHAPVSARESKVEGYLVLLGEIQEEPAQIDAGALESRLGAALSQLNHEFEDDIAWPFTMEKGFPEFTAVLRDPKPVYAVLRHLLNAARPLRVYLAAAEGKVANLGLVEEPHDLEGEGIDRAGELLYKAKKDDRLMLLDSGDAKTDALVNTVMLLLDREFRGWTDRQWEVVNLYRELGRQTEVAERLQISQQSVSSSLAGAGWKVVSSVEDALDQALSEFASEPSMPLQS